MKTPAELLKRYQQDIEDIVARRKMEERLEEIAKEEIIKGLHQNMKDYMGKRYKHNGKRIKGQRKKSRDLSDV